MRTMEILSVFLGFLLLPMLVHGRNQTGFISIDCGIAEGSSYKDDTTEILYNSDSTFAGVNQNISSIFISQALPKQLWNVRSFPQGERNCYTLKPEQGRDNKYLIRASFMYGNYDSKDQIPVFGLYLGVAEWDSITFRNNSHIVIKEILHVPSTDYIDVCLVNNGSGTPFISALELRQLDNSTYITQSGSLMLHTRLDVGSTSNQSVRYYDDVYDRIWEPISRPDWQPINATYSTGRLSFNNYRPPPTVMSTAVIPANGGKSLEFSWKPSGPGKPIFTYMHFAEVEDLQANQLREFNISLNGFHWRGPIVPKRLTPTIANNSFSVITGENPFTYSIIMTNDSTLPPLLNALEIYELKEFQQSPTHLDDVSTIKGIQSKYKIERNWQGDPCLPKVFSWDGLNCSYDNYNPPRIISLNLSSSGLTGRMDSLLSNLKSLESLDLSNNNLTGQVPNALAELTSLKTLNLYGNKLTGSVPSALLDRADTGLLSLSVGGNPDLCATFSCKNKKKNLVVPLVASIASFLVLLGALVLWILRKHRQGSVAKPSGDGKWDTKNQKFSYSEIVSITNNFQRVIGKGGSGSVYHGNLKDGTKVAVKMLSPLATHGSEQFQTEAHLLTRVHHRNLASLIGFCDEGSNMGLIYEYMANGNLRHHLSGVEENATILSWEQRLHIAVDAAQALEYLHNGCKPPIIHRDIKTENILLNEKLQAKVCDFGLSRFLPFESGTHASTTVVGTFGYLDPEYYISNRLNEKSDVYSFGVVLLELITGLPAIQTKLDKPHIVQWVNPMLERGEIRNIIDPRLQGDFDTNSVWKALETAMACVPSSSIQRPPMGHVVVDLKECLEMEIARKSSQRIREKLDATPRNLNEMVCLDIENSIGPQAR